MPVPYRIQAVVFDWAGTTVDFGSRAPAQVFVEIFRRRGVGITVSEARGPMGRAKHEHIAAVLAMPRVSAEWQRVHGRPATEADVQAMYQDFLPLQKSVLADGSDVIAGIPDTVAWLRQRNIRVGSTTGYTRELMNVVAPLAARQGYIPDVIVCSDEVSAGRPAPWLNLRAAAELRTDSPLNVLVVDDTAVGIEAGKAAGMMTVAVSLTGNALGLSHEEVCQLSADDLNQRLREIEQEFRAVGADYVITSVAELPELLRGAPFHLT
ncbi:phosphonoacetaldehyde hydrolase [Planctomycetia bacterium]|nr:phosphonoacetaldehyde hydrolase [Planctomycetia bacterium]